MDGEEAVNEQVVIEITEQDNAEDESRGDSSTTDPVMKHAEVRMIN